MLFFKLKKYNLYLVVTYYTRDLLDEIRKKHKLKIYSLIEYKQVDCYDLELRIGTTKSTNKIEKILNKHFKNNLIDYDIIKE